MKVLITGATGFLGGHLVKALVDAGYEVVALKRKSSNLTQLHDVIEKVFFYDVECGLDGLQSIHPDVDVIIHAATCYGNGGENMLQVFETNVMFPLQLLELYKVNDKCCFLNTDTYFSKNESEYNHLATYSYSKSVFRNLGGRLASLSQMTFINVQLEHVYGPGDGSKKFTSAIFQQIFDNAPTIELTKGEQERDFIYVSDVVDAYLAIIRCKDVVESESVFTFEIGRGKPCTIRKFVETVKHGMNADSTLMFGALPYREHELKKSVANLKPLEKLDWFSKVSLEDGIKKVFAYMRKRTSHES